MGLENLDAHPVSHGVPLHVLDIETNRGHGFDEISGFRVKISATVADQQFALNIHVVIEITPIDDLFSYLFSKIFTNMHNVSPGSKPLLGSDERSSARTADAVCRRPGT